MDTSHTFEYISNTTRTENMEITEIVGFDMKHGTEWYKEKKKEIEERWKNENKLG